MGKKFKKSKFFRVFTEGHTTDGRVVERKWIEDIVATYNTDKYGARIWMEHIRGMTADSPFKAYGDVCAVKAEEVDGKLTLFAQIEPTEELIAMNQKKQKLYTSVEIDPDFAKSGQCYLTGLAVTDSPASLGTDMLEFSAKQAENNPLSSRKQKPENLFTASIETEFEFEEVSDDEGDKEGLFTKVKNLLGKNKKQNDADFSDVHKAVETIAQSVVDSETNFSKQLNEANENFTKLQEEHEQLSKDFTELKEKLDEEEKDGQFRSKATGGNDQVKTDC